MKEYNNIELFDAYLNGTMSEKEKKSFESHLAEDLSFKQEFSMHKELIYLLQKTCGEADSEFAQAMKAISDDDFHEIVSENRLKFKDKPKNRVVPLKSVFRWMSIAAMLVLIAGVGIHRYVSIQNRNNVCDAIYATGFNSEDLSRGEGQITKLEEDFNNAVTLIDELPDKAAEQLERIFNSNDPDAQSIKVDCAIPLAYAYIKAHDIENAKNTIKSVEVLNNGLIPEELEKLQQALENL